MSTDAVPIIPKRCQDLTGRVMGRVTVVAFAGLSESHQARWRCRCECGREVVLVGGRLISGHTTACGCRKGKRPYPNRGRMPERGVWRAMVSRCHKPECHNYPNYGGRGIAVCERWRDSFDNFLADMGRRPSPAYSIERIDNDGGYHPGNCRWATMKEQGRNRRTNLLLTHDGATRTLADWAVVTGLTRSAIAHRLKKMGWSHERALATPPLRHRKRQVAPKSALL